MRWNKKASTKSDKTETVRTPKRGVVGYSRKSALLEEAITQMNAGKYGRSSTALKELLALDPVNMEARRLFATLHLRLGSLIPAREAFDSLITEAFQRQDYWLAESLLREYLAAGPRCVPYLEKLGTIYQEKGNVLEAVEEYGKAVDILIEDPDPERPDHAGQLYSKIRELAPASPVAFRLASFFDAETGRLVARQSSAPETDPVLHQDVLGEDSGEQAASSGADGMMPWEVQVSPAEVEPSGETSHPRDIAQPAEQSEHRADSPQQVQSSEHSLDRSRELHAAEGEPIVIEVQTDRQAESSIQEVGDVLAVAEVSQLAAEREVAGDSLPSLSSEESQTAISVASSEAHRDVVDADSVLLQAPEPVSPEVAEATAVTTDRPPSGAIRVDSEQTVDPSRTFSEDSTEPSLPSQPQTDQEPSSSVRTESSLSEPILGSNKEEASLPTDEVERLQAEEKPCSADSPIDPAPVLADETVQPWKQPGFSWKSVFDTAWKFGEQSPAKDVSTSPAPTCLEGTIADTSPVSSSPGGLVEASAVETPKREGESGKVDEETSRSPIAPMPWDQVEESVHSIASVETNSLIAAEPLEQSVDQSQDPDSSLQAHESHRPPSPSTKEPDLEQDTFSFAQAVPTGHSEERHDSAVGVGSPSTTDQGTERVAESAPLFSFVQSSQADEAESPALQESVAQACTQDSSPGSVVDQHEICDQPTEFAIKREQPHPSAVTDEIEQGFKTEFQAHDSQPVNLVLLEKSETIRPVELDPIEPSPTKPIIDNGERLPETQRGARVLPHGDQPPEVVNVQARTPIPEPMLPQPERMEVDNLTGAGREHVVTSVTSAKPVILERQEVSQPLPATSETDAVFVESSRIRRTPEARPRINEPAQGQESTAIFTRAGITILGFLRVCFSTTQAIVRTVVGLTMLIGVCIALGLGALALTWMIMEEPPSPTFQSFTTTPQQTLFGAQKNAYTLLLGIDAPAGQDPLRAEGQRQSAIGDSATALSCFGTSGSKTGDRSSASGGTMRGWVRGSDPIGQFKSHQETIQGWGSRHQATLDRYRQWQKLPFEDWGYGQPISPPCEAMAFAHQLHVADGFAQGTDVGVDRLETDMEMWRVVLSQARTLPVKMLALQAVNDDIALASGLLVRSDFDTKHLGRITKFVRPLDQAELSLRWPMQSELVSAGKTYESQLKAARAEDQAISSMVVSALPLPKQRRLNDYATYYEASYQAVGEKHYDSLPKWKDHVRFPAAGVMDYLTNPIENLVGLDPLPAWDVYNGMMVDTDAHLRLASLQAWLRRGSSEGDLPNKIAKAGQNFYDPYTGLPMLVNQKKGLLYSVGHDGKDQDADPQGDVVVEIPAAYSSAGQAKTSASSSNSK
ncbi:MAG: tetratricopeptide repeat protein [Nitrospira sp.]|nr:tetratricopeptide repeat protein [Nitrospira sp.]